MSNFVPLFELDIDFVEKEKIKGKKETNDGKFDIFKIQGGAFYLSKDMEKVDVVILPIYISHFYRMGELGLLKGTALEIYEENKDDFKDL